MILLLLALSTAPSSQPSGHNVGLRELLPPYEDSNGVMLDKNRIIDGNALLYTGAKFILLAEEGALNDADRYTYQRMLMVQKATGLLERYTKPGDHQTQDDYEGMFVASMLFDDGQFARDAVLYGRKNWYAWDNQNLGKWSLECFFARFPGWWAMAKSAAGEWLNPFDQFMVFLGMCEIIFHENGSSGTLMTYLKYKVIVRQNSWWANPLARLGCVVFRTAYLRRHPSGIKESYRDYFGSGYPFANIKDGTF